MEVFISWSGDRSEKVAEALRDWLPSAIQSVSPFMSASDIDKGSRWSNDLATHLESAQFGLICLTQENLKAPWLLFEAGALSKSLENSRVVPYLYKVSQAQLQGPLAQFQASIADKSSTWEVIESINAALEGNGLESTRLESAFETWWPQLKKALDIIPESTGEVPPSRTDRNILEEVLRLCRQISRQSIPNLELEEEALRNLVAHGLPIDPVDSTEDGDAANLKLPVGTALRRWKLRRQLEREFRERRLQNTFQRLSDAHPLSKSEVQSSNDADREA